MWAFYIIIVGIRGICIAKSQRKQLEAEEEEYAEFVRKSLEYEEAGRPPPSKMVEMKNIDGNDQTKYVRSMRRPPVDPFISDGRKPVYS